ncbi:transposase [Streptomyces mirabilis]|uniref:transposase n=1 Tax=Streptomyces mirabilis TaxID=68239 RepID=UPI003D9EEF36
MIGGNHHKVTQLVPLIDAIPRIRGLRGRPRSKPKRLFADRGYDYDTYRRLLWKRGIKPLIARRGVAHGDHLPDGALIRSAWRRAHRSAPGFPLSSGQGLPLR